MKESKILFPAILVVSVAGWSCKSGPPTCRGLLQNRTLNLQETADAPLVAADESSAGQTLPSFPRWLASDGSSVAFHRLEAEYALRAVFRKGRTGTQEEEYAGPHRNHTENS